jgi:phage-related protein
MLSVAWDADAQEELRRLPSAERRAVMTAVAKLEAFGDQLGAPHSSQVKGSNAGIRELAAPSRALALAGAVPAAGSDDGDSGYRAGGRA